MGQVHHGYKLHTSIGDPSAKLSWTSCKFTHRAILLLPQMQINNSRFHKRLKKIVWLIFLSRSEAGGDGRKWLEYMELTNLAISMVMFCAALPCSPLWYLLACQSLTNLSSLLWRLVLLSCAIARSWHCFPAWCKCARQFRGHVILLPWAAPSSLPVAVYAVQFPTHCGRQYFSPNSPQWQMSHSSVSSQILKTKYCHWYILANVLVWS